MEPQMQTNNMTEMEVPQVSPPEKKSMGPLIGAGIIIILMAAGGLYFWGARLNNSYNAPPVILGDDAAGLPPTSSSDVVANIEADVSATNLDTMDSQIEADMQAIESSM